LFLTRLRNHTKFLVVYSYQNWDVAVDSVIHAHFNLLSRVEGRAIEAHVLRPR
jgi:hypothetical protein